MYNRRKGGDGNGRDKRQVIGEIEKRRRKFIVIFMIYIIYIYVLLFYILLYLYYIYIL